MDKSKSNSGGASGAPNSTVIPNDLPNGVDALKEYHNGEITDRNGQHHPIAEFLYQLTKMLTDDNHEIIEWSEGKIKVHHPDRLETEVLSLYFRHSRFASFQRQLNYFGFRKIAGKGKMSPCSYVNEAATSDIRSLLLIKRKTNGNARKAAMQQHHQQQMQHLNPMMNALSYPGQQQFGGFFNAHMAGAPNMQNALSQLQQMNQKQQGASPNNSLGNNMTQLLAVQQQQQLQQQVQGRQFGNQGAVMPPPTGQSPSTLTQNIFASSQAPVPTFMGSNANNFNSQSSFEQFQNQLAALTGGVSFNGSTALPSMNSFSMTPQQNQKQESKSPAPAPGGAATAALAQMYGDNPATAAMDASAATSNYNPFDSSINLRKLLGESQDGNKQQQQQQQQQQFSIPLNGNMSSLLLSQLPSSSLIFPSSASFGNLLGGGSTNRINSLLSLNSLGVSREPSLADFAAVAMQQRQQQQQKQPAAAAKKVGDTA